MTTTASLAEQIADLRKRSEEALAQRVITVMSGKGGVGKTLLALELSYLFNAVLVDLDWDGGRASRAMGYQHQRYSRVPLLDALSTGKTPIPKRLPRRPDFIPGHPEFAAAQPEPQALADTLTQWAIELKRPLVPDTHPGGGDATFGALGAADVVVHPVQLATRELDALEETLEELAAYPLILVPNEVPRVPPAKSYQRLKSLALEYDVRVATPIGDYSWYRQRQLRTVITASPTFSQRTEPMAEQLVAVAEGVFSYVTS